MVWILEEIQFTAVFLNQGGGHTLNGFSDQPLEISPLSLACAIIVFSLSGQAFTSQKLEAIRVTSSFVRSCNYTESCLASGLVFDKCKKYPL